MSKSWGIRPGRGTNILAGLGEDVRQRARLGPPTPQLRAEAAMHEDAAEAIIARGRDILTAENFGISSNQLLNRLMVAEQKSLAATRIGSSLLDSIEELESKNYLIADPYEWRTHLGIRLTPLVEDAVQWRVMSGASPRTRARETRMLQAGEEREGRFPKHGSLLSAPALGGRLVLDVGSFLEAKTVVVTGLVSPETGEPQVNLEVLARN